MAFIDPFEQKATNSFVDPFAKGANAPSPGLPQAKPGGAWDTIKTIAKEPFKLAGEAIAAPINAVVKAGKGYAGLASMAKAGLQGKSFDEALQAGTEMIGERNTVSSPLGASKTSEFLGEKVIMPGIQKLGEVTGQPELVEGAAELGGDVAAIFGAKVLAPKIAKGARTVAVKSGVPSVIEGAANKLTDMTLKQQTNLKPEFRAQNIATAHKGGFLPSEAGVNSLDSAITAQESLLQGMINKGDSSGVKATLSKSIQNLEDLKKDAARSGDYEGNLAKINSEIESLRNHPLIDADGNINMSVLQDMKVRQGREITDKYISRDGQTSTFDDEIAKSKVRGYKEGIESAFDSSFPELAGEIRGTNKNLSEFYQLKKQLVRAANRIGNREGIGIGVPIKVGTGSLFGPGGAAVGALISIIEHPRIAPRIARQLYNTSKKLEGGFKTYGEALAETRSRLESIKATVATDLTPPPTSGGSPPVFNPEVLPGRQSSQMDIIPGRETAITPDAVIPPIKETLGLPSPAITVTAEGTAITPGQRNSLISDTITPSGLTDTQIQRAAGNLNKPFVPKDDVSGVKGVSATTPDVIDWIIEDAKGWDHGNIIINGHRAERSWSNKTDIFPWLENYPTVNPGHIITALKKHKAGEKLGPREQVLVEEALKDAYGKIAREQAIDADGAADFAATRAYMKNPTAGGYTVDPEFGFANGGKVKQTYRQRTGKQSINQNEK